MIPKQSQLNIGTLGHVDHGKTTLTSAITHEWTDLHSESIKRSMTIKLGYADAVISVCGDPNEMSSYTTDTKCPEGKTGKLEQVRRISLLDAPGHETLMATAIAGSNIIDAALFVIAANETCPMPQTKEHLMIINALGIKNVIVVQTKVDIVGREQAVKHYNQIRQFLKGSKIENTDIIPVMANRGINVDAVLKRIVDIEVPKRDTQADPVMYVARSFDVNRPGTPIRKILGGVVGGSVIRGKFKVGDEVEIRPGASVSRQKKETYEPIFTKIESISTHDERLDEATAGGLIALGTDIDPSYAKADALVGQLIGRVGKLPEVSSKISLNYVSLNRDDIPKQAFTKGEAVLMGIGTGTFVGYVQNVRRNSLEIELKHPACIDKDEKISLLRNFSQRWRLSGYGTLA